MARITPNTPDLPEIVASAFEVCGQVLVIQAIPDLSSPVRSVRIDDTSSTSPLDTMNVEADAYGKFCTKLPPGSYYIQASVTDNEAKAGLMFNPIGQKVTVVDKPVGSIIFQQFLANVSGIVICFDLCKYVQLVIRPLGSKKPEQQVTAKAESGYFLFPNILPGEYEIVILREEWCWLKDTVHIKVADKDVTDVMFQQSGYLLTVISSHQTTVGCFLKQQRISDMEFIKGTTKHCLTDRGKYTFKPVGCHYFGAEEFFFDTDSPAVIALKATLHLVSGSVFSDVGASDIKVVVKRVEVSKGSQQEGMVGPLKADSSLTSGDFQYPFTFWAPPDYSLDFIPKSEQLLFYPQQKSIITVDDCMQNVLQFSGKKGLFIEGKIHPPLDKVKVTIVATDSSIEPIVLYTGADGKYRVGPFHSIDKFEVTAERHGYILSRKDEFGYFEAYKLSEVVVELVDNMSRPLAGVLLSLSGDGDYRQNSITQEDGKMIFTALSPGQYFLRPMMKEFKFEPTSKVVDVKQGLTVNVKFRGNRTAFSCYGMTTSLTGEPEPGVVLVAVGQDSCHEFEEEGVSETDGAFRIRGLIPNCTYVIQIKKSLELNHHVERSVPSKRTIQINDKDVTGISLIVFRPATHMDLSGNVDTPPEYLNSLKVILRREANLDQALYTVTIGASSFFQLPLIPLDRKLYVVSLESSLSSSMYEFELPEVAFLANVTYRHFNLKFAPRPKSVDHEMGQGSYLALPIAVIAILAFTNASKLIPYALQVRHFLQTILTSNDDVQVVEQLVARKKIKSRKTQ